MIWKDGGEFWKKGRVHLGRQKEEFEAEIYVMSEAMQSADEIGGERKVS